MTGHKKKINMKAEEILTRHQQKVVDMLLGNLLTLNLLIGMCKIVLDMV